MLPVFLLSIPAGLANHDPELQLVMNFANAPGLQLRPSGRARESARERERARERARQRQRQRDREKGGREGGKDAEERGENLGRTIGEPSSTSALRGTEQRSWVSRAHRAVRTARAAGPARQRERHSERHRTQA